MPIYHFNINDELDAEGRHFDDIGIAKCEALKLAGRVICDEHADTFWDCAEWTMTVTNPDRLMLFQRVLIGTEAPVTQKAIHLPLV